MREPFALFSDPHCRHERMRFCLSKFKSPDERKRLQEKIKKYDGYVKASVVDPHAIILVEDEHANSFSDYVAGPPIFKASYVRRCIEEERVLDITNFLVSNILVKKEELNFMDVVYYQEFEWAPFQPLLHSRRNQVGPRAAPMPQPRPQPRPYAWPQLRPYPWPQLRPQLLPFHPPHNNNVVRGPVNVVVTQHNAVQGPINVVVTQHNAVQSQKIAIDVDAGHVQNIAMDVDAGHVHAVSREKDRNIQNSEEPQAGPSWLFSPASQSPNPNALQASANVVITPRDNAVEVARQDDGQIVFEEEDGNIAKLKYETSGQFDPDKMFTQKSCSVEPTNSHSTPTFNDRKEDVNLVKMSDSSESNSPTEGDAQSSPPVANEKSNSSSCKFGCSINIKNNRLRQHYLEKHAADFCTACPYCGEKFYLVKQLNAHYVNCYPKTMVDGQQVQGYWNQIELNLTILKKSDHKKQRYSKLALRYLKSQITEYAFGGKDKQGIKKETYDTRKSILKPYHVPEDETPKPESIWNVSHCMLNRWAEDDWDSYNKAYENLEKKKDVALALSVIPDTIFSETFAESVKMRYPTNEETNLGKWILQPCFSECRHPYSTNELSYLDRIPKKKTK